MESNYEGYVFGRLLVRLDLGLVYNNNLNKRKRKVLAECLNCQPQVKSYCITDLIRGKTKSCGCLRKEYILEKLTKHKRADTPMHNIWRSMKQRCLNSNDRGYKHYGGRGITVCERWENSFDNFLADMGEKPLGCELDRINNEKGYSPENCRWATKSENAFNTRKRKDNTSGKTGVSWNKNSKKWRVQIWVNGEQKSLGLFENFDEAVQARKQAEFEFFGYTKD